MPQKPLTIDDLTPRELQLLKWFWNNRTSDLDRIIDQRLAELDAERPSGKQQ